MRKLVRKSDLLILKILLILLSEWLMNELSSCFHSSLTREKEKSRLYINLLILIYKYIYIYCKLRKHKNIYNKLKILINWIKFLNIQLFRLINKYRHNEKRWVLIARTEKKRHDGASNPTRGWHLTNVLRTDRVNRESLRKQSNVSVFLTRYSIGEKLFVAVTYRRCIIIKSGFS